MTATLNVPVKASDGDAPISAECNCLDPDPENCLVCFYMPSMTATSTIINATAQAHDYCLDCETHHAEEAFCEMHTD